MKRIAAKTIPYREELEMSDAITDEIANTVAKMLKDTADKIKKDDRNWEPPKNLAAAALTPVYNYSFGILLLAEKP